MKLMVQRNSLETGLQSKYHAHPGSRGFMSNHSPQANLVSLEWQKEIQLNQRRLWIKSRLMGAVNNKTTTTTSQCEEHWRPNKCKKKVRNRCFPHLFKYFCPNFLSNYSKTWPNVLFRIIEFIPTTLSRWFTGRPTFTPSPAATSCG